MSALPWFSTPSRCLCFVNGGDQLFQLGLLLLLGPAVGLRYRGVGTTVEDLLPIEGALPESSPTLCVVVVHVIRVDWCRRDIVLQRAEVGEDFGNSRRTVWVD